MKHSMATIFRRIKALEKTANKQGRRLKYLLMSDDTIIFIKCQYGASFSFCHDAAELECPMFLNGYHVLNHNSLNFCAVSYLYY